MLSSPDGVVKVNCIRAIRACLGPNQAPLKKASPGEPAQPRMGHSTGHWEDGALVVETRDIDWRYVDDLGTPQSEDVVIDERFSLSENGTDLYWTARITDPVNFTAPVRMEMRWTWLPGNEIKPFNCALPEDR